MSVASDRLAASSASLTVSVPGIAASLSRLVGGMGHTPYSGAGAAAANYQMEGAP